jgi:putative tryptophan/tyrosine transport system substrate-binding protein
MAAGAMLGARIAAAQPQAMKAKAHRVAFVAGSAPLSELTGPTPVNPSVRAFVLRLRELGYVEGQNLRLDMRTLEGRFERSAEVIADVVRLKADVIVLTSLQVAQRGHEASAGVPIVLLAGGGVVESGLVRSLARPGGSVTGLLLDVDSGVEAKRLELLREVLPKVRRLAFLGSPRAWDSPWGRSALAAAQSLGLSIAPAAKGDTSADYDEALAAIHRERPDAVFVPTGPVSFAQRERIGRFVAEKRIPCAAAFAEIVEHGCLMSYGTNNIQLAGRAAEYVAKILEGAKPGDLPMEQPKSYELVINMKTAKALGLTIPQTILLRADRVIE